MSTYFKHNILYKGVSFQLSNQMQIEEREIHPYHEILYFIDGDGEFLAENMQTPLKDNTLFLIPKESYHFFRFNTSKGFTRLKIAFYDEAIEDSPISSIMGRLSVLNGLKESVSFLLGRLCTVIQDETTAQQGFYVYSIFLMLLTELDILGANMQSEVHSHPSALALEILRYISNHISDDLSIDTIAVNTHISPSTITHCFKKELGISVHQYITQKRLIYGQSLILAGHKPTKIYFKCGYKDYSSFYKAYVLFFGHSPSAERKLDI